MTAVAHILSVPRPVVHRFPALSPRRECGADLVLRYLHEPLPAMTRPASLVRGATAILLGTFLAACQADAGTSPPPAVAGVDTVYFDGFESDDLAGWEDGVDPNRHRIVTGGDRVRSGSGALEIVYPPGDDGGWLTRFFLPGFDSIYVSLHVRYDATWTGGTKLIALYGSRIDNRWSALGQAGTCPDGNDFFAAMLVTEPGTEFPMATNFYTYYPGMSRQPDGTTCWGVSGADRAIRFPPTSISRGGWHHFEFWVRLNTPGASDGEQRFWIDGDLRGEWSGLNFRSTDSLRLNAFQITANATPINSPRYMYIDDVLVAGARPQP
jgi:hypothetical protein